MSQAKVDKYKEYKKNRRANIAKEKRKELLGRIAAWFVVALFVAFSRSRLTRRVRLHCRITPAAVMCCPIWQAFWRQRPIQQNKSSFVMRKK